jgi:hypothetical protein
MGKNAGKIPHLPQRKKNNREERRLSAGFSSNSPRLSLGIFRGSTGNCLIRLGSYSAHPAPERSADKSGGSEPPSTFPENRRPLVARSRRNPSHRQRKPRLTALGAQNDAAFLHPVIAATRQL